MFDTEKHLLETIISQQKEILTTMSTQQQALTDLNAAVTKLSQDASAGFSKITAVLTDLVAKQANPADAAAIENAVASINQIDQNFQSLAQSASAADPSASPTSATPTPAQGSSAT